MKDVLTQIKEKEAQEVSRSRKDEIRRESPAGY